MGRRVTRRRFPRRVCDAVRHAVSRSRTARTLHETPCVPLAHKPASRRALPAANSTHAARNAVRPLRSQACLAASAAGSEQHARCTKRRASRFLTSHDTTQPPLFGRDPPLRGLHIRDDNFLNRNAARAQPRNIVRNSWSASTRLRTLYKVYTRQRGAGRVFVRCGKKRIMTSCAARTERKHRPHADSPQ